VLAGDGEGKLVLWNVQATEAVRVFSDGTGETGHTREITSIVFSEDNSRALTGSVDRTMILWDVATGEPIQTYDHGGRILGVGFAADEAQVYSGSSDDAIIVWDTATGEAVTTINIGMDGETRYTTAIAFHQGNDFALTGHTDGNVNLWQVNEGRRITTYDYNFSNSDSNPKQITALSFRNDGLAALVGARNRVVFEVRTLPLDELILWTRANRYIPTLSCEEREIYNIACDTPEMTPTPSAEESAEGTGDTTG
ncbi:MAG: hypothetical protein AAF125_10715, partial [Chloroflexota bacterium]